MKIRPASPALGLLLASLLAGCGGGGSSSDAGIPSTTSYAVGAAYRNFVSATKDITASGTGSDGNRYTFRLQQQPLAAAAFPVTGATASVVRQTVTLTGPGSSGGSSVNTYYDTGTFAPLGSFDPATGACSRVTGYTALPATANIGATGALSTDVDLSTCSTAAAQTGSTDTRWSLEGARGTDGTSFALLCQSATLAATATSPSSAISICIEISTDGTLGNRLRFYTRISNTPLFELTATNY